MNALGSLSLGPVMPSAADLPLGSLSPFGYGSSQTLPGVASPLGAAPIAGNPLGYAPVSAVQDTYDLDSGGGQSYPAGIEDTYDLDSGGDSAAQMSLDNEKEDKHRWRKLFDGLGKGIAGQQGSGGSVGAPSAPQAGSLGVLEGLPPQFLQPLMQLLQGR